MFDARKYWDDRLSSRYDLVGVGDISLGENYNKWSYKVTRSIMKRLFHKYTNGLQNNKVLDIGPGTGFVVEIWKEMNKDLTGVDISATAVKNLSGRFPDYKFMEFDMGSGKVNLPDNFFSCCSAASVLYHIVEDEGLNMALSNIHRVLQKDGIFIFSDNFIHNDQYHITHQKCRTLDEYVMMLKQNGFEILDRVPNYVLMNDPVDAKGKFYPRLWSLFTRLSRKSAILDSMIWPALYPVELMLTSVFKESPSQEFMICKAVK